MGTKHPDVVVAPPSAMTALTLAEMHVRRWELKAVCSRCGIKLPKGEGTLTCGTCGAKYRLEGDRLAVA